MFLANLNPREKQLFLDVAVGISTLDNQIEAQQKAILEAYVREMQLATVTVDIPSSIEPQIKELAETSSIEIKRIMFLELFSLVAASTSLSERRQEILNNVANSFGFTEKDIEKMVGLHSGYVKAYTDLTHFVQTGE